MAHNIAYDLSTNKQYKIIVINNFADEPFITSDQPVININPLGHEDENLDIYYPLSERKAILFLSSEYYKDITDIHTNDEVSFFNKRICDQAGETIYSSSKEVIKKYKKDFNSRKFKTWAASVNSGGKSQESNLPGAAGGTNWS